MTKCHLLLEEGQWQRSVRHAPEVQQCESRHPLNCANERHRNWQCSRRFLLEATSRRVGGLVPWRTQTLCVRADLTHGLVRTCTQGLNPGHFISMHTVHFPAPGLLTPCDNTTDAFTLKPWVGGLGTALATGGFKSASSTCPTCVCRGEIVFTMPRLITPPVLWASNAPLSPVLWLYRQSQIVGDQAEAGKITAILHPATAQTTGVLLAQTPTTPFRQPGHLPAGCLSPLATLDDFVLHWLYNNVRSNTPCWWQ